jgi:soluble lytic murein transglycosylase
VSIKRTVLLGMFGVACTTALGAGLVTFEYPGFTRVGFAQAASESALTAVRRSDVAAKDGQGNIVRLSPAEHMRRASIYMSNRAFAEARAHWHALINYYPTDPRVPEAMFGIGRSHFQGKNYPEAYAAFDELARNHSSVKEGREGVNYSAAALLRMGRFAEAAARYAEYVDRFPNGERVDTAHLNVIDTLREANRPQDALQWVTRTRQRFAGSATETNAIFAALRLHIAEGEWLQAITASDQLRGRTFNKLVQTSPGEVAYLRAFSLEHAGRNEEAIAAYLAIPDGPESYYGWLASKRVKKLATGSKQSLLSDRANRVNSSIAAVSASYPAPYRQSLLNAARSRKIDPRFLLALIKQESVFKPQAKSPAGARGLLQLTIDTAQKYAPAVGFVGLSESQLYRPETSILLGAEYIEQLSGLFPQQLEAVAASYNGGEDNVARWLKRGKHKDPGLFTAEIGFDETKGYVQKVMANYRVYTELYTVDLVRR